MILRRAALVVLPFLVLVVLLFGFGPELALGIVGGLCAAFIVLRFPVAGIGLLILLLPFNALVSQVQPGTVGTVYGALKDGLLALILVHALATRKVRLVPRPVVVLVLLLVLLPLVSALFTPSLEQALYGWRNDYEPLLLLIAIAAVVERKHIRPLMVMIALMAQLSAVVGILTWSRGLQWLFEIGRLPVPDGTRFPTSLFSQGSIVPRAFSPYVAPNEMAAAMLISLACIWCLPGVKARWRLLLTVLPTAVIVLTESRSGLLGAAVLLLVLLARGIRRQSAMLSTTFLVIAGLGVMAGAWLFIGDTLGSGSDASFGGHATSLQEGVQQVLLHPLGMGLGTVGPAALQYEVSYHVESYWLLLALESGPLVLILFLALLAVLAARGARSPNSAGFMIAAALAATVVSQIVLPTLQTGPVSFLLWIVGGIALAAQRTADSGEPLKVAISTRGATSS